jgi:hypothetical protein
MKEVVSNAHVHRCVLTTGCDEESDLIVATTTSIGDNISAIVVDDVNDVLYVGTTYNGILRCVLTTGCDEGSDFTKAYYSGEGAESMVIDEANGVLYVGTRSMTSSLILRCVLSTGCDTTGEFSPRLIR